MPGTPDSSLTARRHRTRGLAAIAVVTLCWSLNFVLAHPAAVSFDPFLLTFLRAAVAALVFVPVVVVRSGRAVLGRANLLAALPLAVAVILGNQVLFLLATRHTTPAHVAILIATIPVFVTLLARVFLHERIAPLRVAGIAIAFAGVTLIALGRGGKGTLEPTLQGDLLALLAALAFASFTVANKHLVGRVGAFPATALVYLAGAGLLLPFALPSLLGGGLGGHSALAWASAGYLTGAATIVAYPLFSYALSRLTASRVSAFTFLQPILAIVLSVALGWERLPAGTLLGGALAAAGVAVAQKRVSVAAPPPPGARGAAGPGRARCGRRARRRRR
jgi:drug/metabolite transporter (DMT)-like permease